jgi:HPt (histidine-containing phosphotransfer) domain-containing protein
LSEEGRFAHLPILAMTAKAMAGDREKALAAGMNDHSPKPINDSQMFQTMAQWSTPSGSTVAARQTADETAIHIPALTGVDIEASLDRLRGNKALYLKLLQKFYHNYQAFDLELDSALATADPESAIRLAHTIKGLAGNMGAIALETIAAQAEQELTAGNADDNTMTALRREVTALLTQIGPGVDTDSAEVAADDFNPEQAKTVLSQLSALLEDYDAAVGTFLPKHEAALASPQLSAGLKKIRQAIEEYDYELALQLAGDMMGKLD